MNITHMLTPIGSTVSASEPLTYAAKQIGDGGRGYVTVVHSQQNPSPLGLITQGDLARIKREYPQQWPLKTCQSALPGPVKYVSPKAAVDEVVARLTESGVRPLLVGGRGSTVSVLEPARIFQWCAEHSPETLEELAYLISAEESRTVQA